jgi:hypothetical protein
MIAPSRVAPGRRGAPHAGRRVGPPGAPPEHIIAFDHAAVFPLSGRPGNVVQDVINVGPEGLFVAVAIGYGFEEERGEDIVVPPPADSRVGSVTLDDVPADALISGLRINRRWLDVVYAPPAAGVSAVREPRLSTDPLPQHLWNHVFQRVRPPVGITFLFSIVDSGTGRELQDEPIHSLASLGRSDGERPFRPLARPMTFLPRSTIRVQIIEQTEGARGTLFIVLYGYKVLAGGCPEPVMRTLHGVPACPTETIGSPSARVIPFDYVAKLPLTGRAGNRVEDEVAVNVDGGFVATALGYGLAVEERGVALSELATRDGTLPAGTVDTKAGLVKLGALPLRLFPPSALADGFRVRPQFLRLAFDNNGARATALPLDLLDRLFERLTRPEDVAFRYALFDSGRGHDLQNRPIFSIAGLGIADGDRPFKPLARPMLFLPRSTIRVDVEERSGRGLLFLVFQGYKILGYPAGAGR